MVKSSCPKSFDPGSEETPGSIKDLSKTVDQLFDRKGLEPFSQDYEELLQPKDYSLFYPYEDYVNSIDQQGCKSDECHCAQSLYWATQDGYRCLSTEIMYWYHPDYLGNVEFVTNNNGKPHQFFWYSPWGEPLVQQYLGAGDFSSRYLFNAKELDEESGNYYYGARYYNPQTSIWLSVDPKAGDYPGWTPYNFTMDNPVVLVDPDGQSANPIYDLDGNFLGTDDQGLKGQAIIMEKGDFTQGMAHKDAEKANVGLGALIWNSDGTSKTSEEANAAYDKVANHYNNLPNRPDYDGYVTNQEAEDWWNHGNGQPLFVDASKLDFLSSRLNVRDFPKNGVQAVNFFDGFNNHPFNDKIIYRPSTNIDLSRVYGTLNLRLVNPGTGAVVPIQRANGSFDTYDFANPLFSAWRSQPGGNPTNYDFYSYGKGHIRK